LYLKLPKSNIYRFFLPNSSPIIPVIIVVIIVVVVVAVRAVIVVVAVGIGVGIVVIVVILAGDLAECADEKQK